jgi:adenosylcobinamide kinase/adenosylcobinamide-phosphate guanylyltransferase
MGKLILVTGGARSGKSTFAENKAKELVKGVGIGVSVGVDARTDLNVITCGNVLYIATAIPFDEEMKERVKLHKERRPHNWLTYEGYRNLKEVYESTEDFKVILLDCITVMVTNLMFDITGENIEEFSNERLELLEKNIFEEIVDFLNVAKQKSQTVIMVTNELGMGIVPEYKFGRVFRDIAGRVNQYIAANADEVYFAVCGIPMKIK